MAKKKTLLRKFYRINQYIQASELRVIDEAGKQIGVVPREKALEKAMSGGLDLVEVASEANPPVAKIIDFKKFLYLEAKKQKGEKKAKGGELKEIRLTPFIGQADFNFRLKRAEEFIEEGNKVKITVFFKGRQITHQGFGRELLTKFCENLSSIAKPEHEPKLIGKILFVSLTPFKGGQDGKIKDQKIN